MTQDNKTNKKNKFTRTNLICILLIIALGMLMITTYAYTNRQEIALRLASKNTSTSTATKEALPTELTTVTSYQYLVNKSHQIPSDYVPTDLTTPYLNSTTDVIQLRQEAADKAKEMKNAASEAGVKLIVSNGYISYATQEEIYRSHQQLLGDAVDLSMPKAGYSEHQLGLAIDFTDDASKSNATSEFANTDAGKWLYEHAHEYGYILRYPEGKSDITGYNYMPWHYRYVGVDVANAMYAISPTETLEEYYNVN